jgi:hypothetical protein
MNQMAIRLSKIAHPNDDVGMKGQMALPWKWCTTSQPACMSQAMPMNRYDWRPRYRNHVMAAG